MASLSESLTWIQTNADGRAALGVITGGLNEAYRLLPQISTSQDLQSNEKGFLDDTNAYAQQIYGDVPDDGNDLSIFNAGRIGICASQADSAINTVTDAVGASRFDFSSAIKQASSEVASDIASGANALGNAAGAAAAAPFQGLVAGLTAFLYGAKTALIIIGVVGGVYIFRGPILRAVKGAT